MKIKDASKKVNDALDGAAAKVERQKMTKWVMVALVAVLLVVMVMWASAAQATGWHHVKPVIIKTVVVKPPVVVPPPAPPPVVTPVPPASAPPAAPAQQPSAGGSGPGTLSWIVFGAVVVYFTAVIRSHMIFCAQREEQWHKDNKVARCYNAERDGLPESRK
ncbi:MAG: hypothetical protein IT349_19210 [Candidatus Eisenbacteria bacterium]|nr:hypothetical protein [Candidatus Eisenbacteria bacterium]